MQTFTAQMKLNFHINAVRTIVKLFSAVTNWTMVHLDKDETPDFWGSVKVEGTNLSKQTELKHQTWIVVKAQLNITVTCQK